jgi:hypothetical protein
MPRGTPDGDRNLVADLQRAHGAPPRNRRKVGPRKLAPIRQGGKLRKGNLESASVGETRPRGVVGIKPPGGSKPRRRTCPSRKARAESTMPQALWRRKTSREPLREDASREESSSCRLARRAKGYERLNSEGATSERKERRRNTHRNLDFAKSLEKGECWKKMTALRFDLKTFENQAIVLRGVSCGLRPAGK